MSARGGGTERLRVDADRAGVRLDKLLASLGSVGSREKARQALRSGKVSVDGAPVGLDDAGRALDPGVEVAIAWTRPGTGARATAAREGLDRAGVNLLVHDADIVAADKPPGLLTDAADVDQAKHRDTLRKRVRAWAGAEVWPVHRIDRDTSGVVLFARTEEAREGLKAQWAERSPVRSYLAVVEGRFPDDAGRFGDWMVWDAGARIQRPAGPDVPGAWFAEADFEVIERFGDRATALGVSLVTGRRNQIRLHAMIAGHPLVGEPLYRMPRPRTVPFERQALHARELGVRHPRTGAPIVLTSPTPADLAGLLARLRR